MQTRPRTPRWPLPLSSAGVLACVALSAAAGCGSNKNHEEREAVAGPEGALCIDNCYPDPLPKPVAEEQCRAAEAGIEFFPLPIWDFEAGVASNMYFYDDKTTWFRVPGSGSGDPDAASWEPTPEQDATNLCGRTNNHVLHTYGGPFTEWGGGMGRSLKALNDSDKEKRSATLPDRSTISRSLGTSDRLGVCESDQQDPLLREACPERDRALLSGVEQSEVEDAFLLRMTLDLSNWEGISFWARRGVNSQAGVRVAVGDKYTADDLSFLQYHVDPDAKRYCERNRECGCRNHKPCTKTVGGKGAEHYCLDTADLEARSVECEPVPGSPVDESKSNGSCEPDFPYKTHGTVECRRFELAEGTRHYCYNTQIAFHPYNFENFECGPTVCDKVYPAFQTADDPFYGKPCTPFAFRGGISGEFCFEPGKDPDPYESLDLCGDNWMKGVRLSTEWQFYKVPFTDLLQQGWAKESFWLDLTSVYEVRFTWDRGWVDYYIDDVRFYRHKSE